MTLQTLWTFDFTDFLTNPDFSGGDGGFWRRLIFYFLNFMEKDKNERIKKTQDLAKKIGHCLCNLKLECPCEDFIKNNVCECSKYMEKAKKK